MYEVTGARGRIDDRFYLSTVCCINDTNEYGVLHLSTEEEYLPSRFLAGGAFYSEPLAEKRGGHVPGISKQYFFLHNFPVRLNVTFSTDRKILQKVVPLEPKGLAIHNIAISQLEVSRAAAGSS